MEDKEVEHFISVLEETRRAIKNNDVVKLRDLSNQTIHTASSDQETGSILMAVLIYTMGKLVERKDSLNIKRWSVFEKRFDSFLSLASISLKKRDFASFEKDLENARKAITSISINLKPYIQEVLRKASINKASKIYEHGISLGQTAKLLGITEWELAEYTAQSDSFSQEDSLNERKRAQIALEFFS